jgi:hypothetical protein
MKLGGKLFAYGAAFYFIVSAIYWFMSKDPVGTTAISLTGGLAFLIGFYTLFTSNRLGELPEDIEHAAISDADSQYGFFSPHSWWPLGLGFSTFLISLGFIFAWWLLIIGVMSLLYTVFGLLFEYYRGNFAA